MHNELQNSQFMILRNFVMISPLAVAICANFLVMTCSNPQKSFISIRGHILPQSLPSSMISNWRTWTFESDTKLLIPVESSLDNPGWLNPTTFQELYLPKDLPLPIAKPALGIVLNYGIPRYIMPSVVLSLETPGQIWRNRGINTLPRAASWIDLYAPNTPTLSNLKLSCFGLSAPNLRFLEDQDGSGSWECLLEQSSRSLLSPSSCIELDITAAFESFSNYLKTINANDVFDGYHFVDIPIPKTEPILLPRIRFKSFLSDFTEPKQLLEVEDPTVLESEPCAVLDLTMTAVAAGRDSQFLPEVYVDLFEEGSIIGG
mmetsp:Transcript_30423/g.43585  ORF Transcript_30423/g.43585 Transcript_30423/m.43585 type:complete len:317 (-) Transcript_30423:2928-3878(-)